MSAGCLPDDCRVGAKRCNGVYLESCVGHPAGVLGPPDSPTVVHGSGPTWEREATCGANACIDDAASGAVFCALEASPAPVCADADVACDGTTLVTCHDGYAIERKACNACNVHGACSFGDAECCAGGYDAPCSLDTDCASGLVCDRTHAIARCGLPCDCPDGAACAQCRVADAFSPDPNLFGARAWTCRSGWCLD